MRVLIVDDHPLYIKGIESLLAELQPNIQTRGAGTVEHALFIAAEFDPELLLLDLKLPGMEQLQALLEIKAAQPSVPIVIISGHDNTADILRSIELGAAGYIPKETEPAAMMQALRTVLARGMYVPPQVLRDSGPSVSSTASAPSLSDRQLTVLQLLLQGKSNKLIARELGIAEGTAKAHLFSVYQALGVNSRLQAMIRANQLGLVDKFVAQLE